MKLQKILDTPQKLLSRFESAVILIARVSIGVVFAQAGWGKLSNLERTIGYFESLGLPFPAAHAGVVGGLELICGSLLLLGLFSQLAAVPLVVIMAVATLTAHREEIEGLTSLFGATTYLYAVILAWIATRGSGVYSLDRFVERRK